MPLAQQPRAEDLGGHIWDKANAITQLGLSLGFVHPKWTDIISWKLYSRRSPKSVLECTLMQPITSGSLRRMGGLTLRLYGQSLELPYNAYVPPGDILVLWGDVPEQPTDMAVLFWDELAELHTALEKVPYCVRLAGISAITAERPTAAVLQLRPSVPPYGGGRP